MDRLFNDLKGTPKIEKIFEAIEESIGVNLSNVKTGLKGFLTLLTYEHFDTNILFITHSDRDAQKKAEILRKFRDTDVLYYPLEPVHDYFSDAHSQNIAHQRMTVIEKLFSEKKYIIVASIDSILKKMVPRVAMEALFFSINNGDTFDLEALVVRLVNLGYERVYQVESKGQFALRGGILDIYNVTSEEAVRIEFFDDEVDSMRLFDVDSQLSYDQIENVRIAPAKEIVLSEEERQRIFKMIHKKYDGNELYMELVEKLEQEGAQYDETLFTFVKENDSFMDYVGKNIVIWDEYTRIKETYDIFIKKTWLDYESLITQGYILPEEKNKFFTFHHIEKSLEGCPAIKEYLFNSRAKKGMNLDMNSRDLESFAGQFPLFLDFLNRRLTLGYRIHICCRTEKTRETVKQYLVDQEVFNFVENEGPGIQLSVGEISEGFEMEDEKVVYINESEIFKEKRTSQRKKKHKGRKIDSFAELHVGDYVVHDVHGIGIYRGIEQLTIDNVTKDLMVIEYAGDAKLYIPVEQMDSVQVYIGTGGDKKPKVNQMGNPDWQKAKNKAQKAVEDMADELIALYAKRRSMKGYAFSPDTSWQKEFEDDFPYVETEDQLRCVEEIKADMESEIPMDRLLCGDVGYGKTEVALRAAFKAVMEGKQVAMLVPTTILAQQHYNTVLERFRKYPISVEVISRFRTSGQQKKILGDLALGKLDMIIGTHRLLSQDVHFKDLGLLIIDEEQRFGVRSKEKIKQLKQNVDVLTLSATPIPRTLHMSMTGVRDMSVIEEPPEGRRPVQTYVMAYNPLIIQDAINRELGRGGQVYYVHNRVHDIHEVAIDVQSLVPDARIVVAHGRMSGSELEDIMVDFLNHDFDILVTTTIVESGLDVKNANTMIIDEGDHFGLSQLYQLRGRVGRSDVQAYTYVTHKKEILTEIAQKRLKAIKDFTAFGSGFKVAMRDLEIRGAGNILGAEQSGHLFKIGYELYCRILEEAISKRMDGVEVETEEPIRINLDIDGYIPERYISSEELKYDIYKKLTFIKTIEDYDDFEEELLDRFGDIPNGVYNLMSIAMIKNMASTIGVKEIKQKGQFIYLTFSEKKEVLVPDAEKMPELIRKYKVKFKAGKANEACWSFNLSSVRDKDILKEIISFFEDLK